MQKADAFLDILEEKVLKIDLMNLLDGTDLGSSKARRISLDAWLQNVRSECAGSTAAECPSGWRQSWHNYVGEGRFSTRESLGSYGHNIHEPISLLIRAEFSRKKH